MATMGWQLLLGEADAAAATWDARSLSDTHAGVKRIVTKQTSASICARAAAGGARVSRGYVRAARPRACRARGCARRSLRVSPRCVARAVSAVARAARRRAPAHPYGARRPAAACAARDRPVLCVAGGAL